MTEQAIIQGCAKQKQKAQKQLVEQYSGYLYTIARRYMPDDESAKDILQESFVKIFTYFHQFSQKKGALKSWMGRIVANESLRKRKHYFDPRKASQEEAMILEVRPKVLSELHAEELIRLIRELPEHYSIVFNMYVLEGYSHDEIGEHLGIASSTSRSNLSRAKNLLRKRIVDLEIDSKWTSIN